MVPNHANQMTSNSGDIPVYENFGSYKPRINAAKIVRDLLRTVPPEYLRGLRSVVVSSQTALSRDQRRKKTRSRGRKVARDQILGYYHPAWLGQMAYIELYVDRICLRLPWPLPWIPIVRHIAVGRVLFHEIGHTFMPRSVRSLGSEKTLLRSGKGS